MNIVNDIPALLEKINFIAQTYSKRKQWIKAAEEVDELRDELRRASNPFDDEGLVFFTSNTWSEVADVIIMGLQLAIQHGKTEKLTEELFYKLDRQIERIQEESE